MIAYSWGKRKYVITKDKVTGFWEVECRFCSHVDKTTSHANAVKNMDAMERSHRGLR